MIPMKRHRAFSLIELMVVIAISVLLIGGVIATFNGINIGIKNTNRSNDLTAVMRNASSIFQADLSEVGRGMADMNTLQVHFQSTLADPNETYFYGVVGLPTKNGFSQVAFQWFDYDPVSQPTLIVMNPGSAPGGTWTSPVTSVELATANTADPALTEFVKGDVVLLYDPRILFDRNLHQSLYTNVKSDYSFDEDVLNNGAMLLEVSSTAPTGPGRLSVTFSSDGVFRNSLVPPTNKYTNTETDFSALITAGLTKGKDEFQFKPPQGVWLARKLGNSSNYRRVRYYVNEKNALIRSDESTGVSQDMVVATNITEFEIEIGTDILNPLDPLAQDPASWDNAVSSSDTGQWFASSSTPAQNILLGRHGVSVRLKLSVKALIRDVQDGNASAGRDDAEYKQRTLEKQFRIRNQHRPQVNY